MVTNNPGGKLPWEATCWSQELMGTEKGLRQRCGEVVATGSPRGKPKSVCNSASRKQILEEFRRDNDLGNMTMDSGRNGNSRKCGDDNEMVPWSGCSVMSKGYWQSAKVIISVF